MPIVTQGSQTHELRRNEIFLNDNSGAQCLAPTEPAKHSSGLVYKHLVPTGLIDRTWRGKPES